MGRIKLFQDRITRLPYSKLAQKLKKSDFDLITNFIHQHDALGNDEFEMRINRLFLDKEKPKNWAIILELLSITNSATRQKS